MVNKRTAELSKDESGGTRSTSPATSRSETSGSMCIRYVSLRMFVIDQESGSKASSPTESKNQIDFQFLNFSHPSEAKGPRARRTVRSHVTKQQHQREHAAAAARRAKSFPRADAESEDVPAPRAHAASYPPNRPTLELPSRPGPATSSSDASSQSPSPTNSPRYLSETRIDPSDVYPEEWHPYLPRIMVSNSMKSLYGSRAHTLAGALPLKYGSRHPRSGRSRRKRTAANAILSVLSNGSSTTTRSHAHGSLSLR